ncbi:MAG: hypothetical protein IK016_11165 [Lachnospiraceae bacterium]|nr:hypothetical protein [Lachnospiraceae bacterium]
MKTTKRFSASFLEKENGEKSKTISIGKVEYPVEYICEIQSDATDHNGTRLLKASSTFTHISEEGDVLITLFDDIAHVECIITFDLPFSV